MPDTPPLSITFASGDGTCAGSLWLPPGTDPRHASNLPVVLLAHGLGGTRAMGLGRFAERFAAAGMAAITFDYRTFGDSSGTPRNLLSIPMQREDWRAAIAFVRADPRFDSARIGLWGTSFGGGHVLAIAAEDHEIAAVVSQCPFTDGPSSALRVDPRSSLRLTARAIADQVARLAGRPPVRVAVAGRPGQAALMTAADALPGYEKLAAEGGVDAATTVAARIGLAIPFSRPGRAISKLKSPTLICICEPDSVAPERATWRFVRSASNPLVDARGYATGHFDIYQGAAFEQAAGDQAAFLAEHLGAQTVTQQGAGPDAAPAASPTVDPAADPAA